MLKLATAGALFALLCGGAFGEKLGIELDPGKTRINWTLAGNVHTVHGTFHLKEGHVAVDPGNGEISGELVADASSGESGNGARDKRMQKEVLQSDRYREIRLTPKRVEGSIGMNGHSRIQLSGEFLLRGIVHNVTIPLDVSFAGDTITGTGKFSVPYVEWGLKDPSNFVFRVDKSVEVEVVAVGRIAAK